MTRLGLGLIMALWISLWQDIVALWNNLWQDFSLVLSWSCELGLGLIMALWNICDKTSTWFYYGSVNLDWAWSLPCETPVARPACFYHGPVNLDWAWSWPCLKHLWQDLSLFLSWSCVLGLGLNIALFETPVIRLELVFVMVLCTWTGLDHCPVKHLWQDFSLILLWSCETTCDKIWTGLDHGLVKHLWQYLDWAWLRSFEPTCDKTSACSYHGSVKQIVTRLGLLPETDSNRLFKNYNVVYLY